MTALEQGRSTEETFTSAPQAIPFRAKVKKNHGKGTKVVNDVFRVSNYDDNYLGSASMATATTYSDNSVYSQIGTQVGVQNVAQTAERMGIETDLSTPGTDYSINDGPWEPYNPALILGGLATGVTPLEMAHAYNTLPEGGNRISGAMAADSGGPVGILDVTDGGDCKADCYQEGDPVPDQTGASGVNKVIAKPVVDPARRRDGEVGALDRGQLRDRPSRSNGRPDLGQDGDHGQQRRRLVLRRDPEDHRLRLGRVPGLGDADGDPVQRRARRRRDLPGADLLPDRQRLRRPRGHPRAGRQVALEERLDLGVHRPDRHRHRPPRDDAPSPPRRRRRRRARAPPTAPGRAPDRRRWGHRRRRGGARGRRRRRLARLGQRRRRAAAATGTRSRRRRSATATRSPW